MPGEEFIDENGVEYIIIERVNSQFVEAWRKHDPKPCHVWVVHYPEPA